MSLRKVIALSLPALCLAVSGYAAPAASALSALSAAGAFGSALVAPGHLSGWMVTTNKTFAPPYDASNLNPLSTAGYTFVKGPGKPPLGRGSLLLTVGPAKNSRVSAVPPGLLGRTFGELTELRYATYLKNVSAAGDILPVNAKLAGVSSTLRGYFTAVFEPGRQSAKAVTKKWQSWNALAGTWWTSKVTSGACSQAKPCGWPALVGKAGAATKIVMAYFELGDSGTGFSDEKCAIDDVRINGVRYDFERFAPSAPTAIVWPFIVGPGASVTVHATGFAGGEKVGTELHSRGVVLGYGTANRFGVVTLTVRIPARTTTGAHVVVLTGLTSGRVATAGIMVTNGPAGPATGFGGLWRQVSRHHPRA